MSMKSEKLSSKNIKPDVILSVEGKEKEQMPNAHQEEENESKSSCTLVVSAAVFILLAGGAAAYVTWITLTKSKAPTSCQIALQNPNISAIRRQECELDDECSFDVSLCSTPCPLSFSSASKDDPCAASCYCAEEAKTFQIDTEYQHKDLEGILEKFGYLDEEEGEGFTVRGTLLVDADLWLDSFKDERYEIGYVVEDGAFSDEEIALIEYELLVISNYTCLTFTKRTTHKYYMYFLNWGYCSTHVGRKFLEENQNRAYISLDPDICLHKNGTIHYVMHSLGFDHETSRPDRDDYVTVNPFNADLSYKVHWEKVEGKYYHDLGLPFDYSSVLLFDGYTYSKEGKPTIKRLDNDEPLVPGSFSEIDAENIRRAYYCRGSYEPVLAESGSFNISDIPEEGELIGGRPEGSSGHSTVGILWTEWNGVKLCNSTCQHVGYRRRYCFAAPLAQCQSAFPGTDHTEFVDCMDYCDKKPSSSWSEWSAWSTCFRLSRYRSRKCNGYYCDGQSTQKVRCVFPLKTAEAVNTRAIDNSSVVEGRSWFEDLQAQYSTDSDEQQPISTNGFGWSRWSAWSDCGFCAENVITTRTRECRDGTTEECLVSFPGTSTEQTRPCFLTLCDSWKKWSAWSVCSRECGDSLSMRTRYCVNNLCNFFDIDVKRCHPGPCSSQRTWTEWEEWNWECENKPCGRRYRRYTRRCVPESNAIGDCPGKNTREEQCDPVPCALYEEYDLYYYDEYYNGTEMFSQDNIVSVGSTCKTKVTDTWLFGDFNGDKLADGMCGQDGGILKVGFSDGKSIMAAPHWVGAIQDCGKGLKLAADFDGDGADDLLCQDIAGRELALILSDSGDFSGKPFLVNKFCTDNNDELMTMDIDGDGKTDILCHHLDTGGYEILVTQ